MMMFSRLVAVVTLCSGLGLWPGVHDKALRLGDGVPPFDYRGKPSDWTSPRNLHSAALLKWNDGDERAGDVPTWLQTLLKRVSTWLDGVIDAIAMRVAVPDPVSAPEVVVSAPGSAPVALTVEQVEATLVVQTNAARAAAGLPPLQVDAALTALARQRSQDMIDRDFFSHTDPVTGGSLVESFCIAPLGVAYCGENLAGAGGLADAEANVVGRWLASDGHRANMLRTEFGRIGIGVAVGGRWGAVVTQLFAPQICVDQLILHCRADQAQPLLGTRGIGS